MIEILSSPAQALATEKPTRKGKVTSGKPKSKANETQ